MGQAWDDRNGHPGRLKVKAPLDWLLGCSESVDAPMSALGISARFENVISRMLDARADLRRIHLAEFADDQRRNARYVRGSHRGAGVEEILVSRSPCGAENQVQKPGRWRCDDGETREIAPRRGDIDH